MNTLNVVILARNINNVQKCSWRRYSDMMPASEAIVIRRKKRKDVSNLEEQKSGESENKTISKEFRVNDVNIQMVSRNIYDQLFKTSPRVIDPYVIKR